MKKRRLGKLQISQKLYDEQWGVIKYLFLEFKPIHIEQNCWIRNQDIFFLYGESDHFDEIDEGEITPNYTLILNFKEAGSPVFNFIKDEL